jgi:hypothetical protein|tara:strand:- start:104 stop:217 length:114 start_codon:yes stop_codon:yes gene_type:complete
MEDEDYLVPIDPLSQEEIDEADNKPFEFEEIRHYESS